MPVAQFGNKDSKNFNGGQVCLEGYAVKYNKADLCHDSASELNETQTHPYWCRIHSYFTCWNNNNKEKWNLISGKEKS